jgi:hypothetical protein
MAVSLALARLAGGHILHIRRILLNFWLVIFSL